MFSRIRRGSRKAAPPEGGFTFVELTVTLILVGFFLAAVTGLVVQGYSFFGTQRNVSTLNSDGDRALGRIESLLRGTKRIIDPASALNTPTPPVGTTQSSTTAYTLYADVDGNSANHDELVTIDRPTTSSKYLRVSVDGVASYILNSLNPDEAAALSFTYYSDYVVWNQYTEITSSSFYNGQADTVLVTLKLRRTSSGKITTRTYSRYIALKLSPDDRRDAPITYP
jgi:hypothetical protein